LALMIKTHKIRLNPTSPQETYFYRASDVARTGWNWADDLQLSDRVWVCPDCGVEHDRDENGAINIEMEGVRLLAGSGYIGVTTVEFAALD
jgi:Putative transposase DNA-binding domain/Helix-turn-helix domain